MAWTPPLLVGGGTRSGYGKRYSDTHLVRREKKRARVGGIVGLWGGEEARAKRKRERRYSEAEGQSSCCSYSKENLLFPDGKSHLVQAFEGWTLGGLRKEKKHRPKGGMGSVTRARGVALNTLFAIRACANEHSSREKPEGGACGGGGWWKRKWVRLITA